jgi:hypothetical protein
VVLYPTIVTRRGLSNHKLQLSQVDVDTKITESFPSKVLKSLPIYGGLKKGTFGTIDSAQAQ